MCLKAQAVFWALKRNNFMHRFYCCNRGLFAGGIDPSARMSEILKLSKREWTGLPFCFLPTLSGVFPCPNRLLLCNLPKILLLSLGN